MTLNDIAILVRDNGEMIAICTAIVMSLIEISPIKLNPWSWIGNVFNKGIIDRIDKQAEDMDELKKQVGDMQKEVNENSAMSSRYRILRFDDEIRHGTLHTKEHYDQIIVDIDIYEEFCKRNPDFRNNLAHMAISNIRQKYSEHNVDNSFL